MEAKDTLAAYSSNPSLAPALRSTADTCQQGVLLEQVEPSSRRWQTRQGNIVSSWLA